MSIIDKLIDDSFISINNRLVLTGGDKVYELFYDNNDQLNEYIAGRFRNNFRDYKLVINEHTDSSDYRIYLSNAAIETSYNKIFTDKVLGTKKLEREISVKYDLRMTGKDSTDVIFVHNFNKKSKDNIDLDKLAFAEDKRYSFSSSELPEENTVNQILFPAIIITISAAAIILFFTIRSK